MIDGLKKTRSQDFILGDVGSFVSLLSFISGGDVGAERDLKIRSVSRYSSASSVTLLEDAKGMEQRA